MASRSRRTAKSHPDWMAYRRAMAARESVLHVIVKTIKKRKIVVSTGSSFVIKVDLQAQQTFLLTSEHVVRGKLKPGPGDGLRVRRMLPVGVEEFPASIIHMNKEMDVAILRVPGLTAARPLRFSPEDPIVGEGIVAAGYCDPDHLFSQLCFSRIPAIHPGRFRGIAECYFHDGILLCHALFSCVAMHGMSGGPIVSKRGVTAMVDSGVVGCTAGVHRRTILEVLKKYVGVQQEADMTMEQVIDLIA